MANCRFLVSYQEKVGASIRASIYAVPGCHVEGRTRSEARVKIIEALSLFYDDVDPSEIVDGDKPKSH